jgi:hypothetical protein
VGGAVVGAAVVGAAVVDGPDHQSLNKFALAIAGVKLFIDVEFHWLPFELVAIKAPFCVCAETYQAEPFHVILPIMAPPNGSLTVHSMPSELVAILLSALAHHWDPFQAISCPMGPLKGLCEISVLLDVQSIPL